MPYDVTPVRFIELAGWRRIVAASWKRPEGCRIEAMYCSEARTVAEGPLPWPADVADHLDVPEQWPPGVCDDCGKPRETGMDVHARSHVSPRWPTTSGKPEPGDMFYVDDDLNSVWHVLHYNRHEPAEPGPLWCGDVFYHQAEDDDSPRRIAHSGWHNCDGRHLVVVLPDRVTWDVDGRANNCALPDDRLHRCWVRAGDPEASPPTVHVSKDGLTCAAGGGSIASPGYHGHLQVHDGRSILTAG